MDFRQLWRSAHRYLGLSLGLLYLVIALSGVLVVYHDAIDQYFNPNLLRVQPAAQTLDADEVVRLATSHGGVQGQLLGMSFPDFRDMPVRVYFGFHGTDREEWRAVMVDQYGGRVLGSRLSDDHWIYVIYDLHTTLLAGEVGEVITGLTGIFLFSSVVLGVYLWWPRRRSWKSALRLRAGGSWRYTLFKGHQVLGIYASLLLLLSAVTGVYLTFPEQAEAVVRQFAAWDTVSPEPRDAADCRENTPGTGTGTGTGTGIAELIAIGERQIPGSRIHQVIFPQPGFPYYYLSARPPGDPRRITGGQGVIWLHAECRKVAGVYDPMRAGPGNFIDSWIFPLHNGEALGQSGRVLVLLTGLVLAVLTGTGCIYWLARQRFWRRRSSG